MTAYTERFEQKVWLRYPKRNGKRSGKIPAFKQWKKLSESQKLHVIDQIEKRNRYDGWGKYIKDCERWLRDHADDEFDVPRSYSDPQAIDIPEKEAPKEECPAKVALTRVWFNFVMDHYRSGKPALTSEDIQRMIAVKNQFAGPLLEAWQKKEDLTGMKEAYIEHLRGEIA